MNKPPQAPAQGTIPFLTLPNWVKAASVCGFNVEPVFRMVGIETDLIHLESATVTPQQLQALMRECVARAKGHHFPFALGETFAFDYMPDIGTFLSTSSTLRDTLPVFQWVRELINPALRVRLVEEGGEAALVLEYSGLPVEPMPYFTESTLSSIVKFGRLLLGEPQVFHRLCLMHAEPAYAVEYARHFAAEVLFSQPRHALVFRRELLDRPLEGAFPLLHKQAEMRVQRQLTRIPRATTAASAFTAEIERVMENRPQLLGQGIERIAEAMGVHPRSLQRRLQEEGAGYAEVVARVRFRLAQQWLQEAGVDIETVSERLGFSDRRSFTRAFTRWAGTSPSQFRLRDKS